MTKKLTTLAFAFMLAFYPFASISAAPADNDAENENVETSNADNTQVEQTENNEDKETDENTAESDVTEEDATSSEEQGESNDANQTGESDVSAEDDVEATNDTTESVDEGQSEATEEEPVEEADSTEESTEADNTVEENDEDNISTLAADEEDEDENTNLNNIYGTADGDITFDLTKGYYVLDLRAGFMSFSSKKITEKWLAFTLPNGVEVADELPRGMIRFVTEGKTALAVKIPNVSGYSTEYVNKKIALKGEVDDNNPYVNLKMLTVDTDAQSYEILGEIKNQRDIDFSVMEENPTINLSGSIDGTTEFDDEKIFYFLNLTVEATNSEYEQIDNLYAAFELPEDVRVLDTDETPVEYEQLIVDGKNVGAVQLPNAVEGDTATKTYSIPIIGKTDAVVNSDTIELYTVENGTYKHVGNTAGNINIDYSNMDQAWHFTTKSEVITDYPGVNDNQKGFRFNYEVKNLTVEDVDKVILEFIVPDSIEINKPQYIGGNNIDWNGNTATVDIGDLRGGFGYHGYFTAVGNTSLSIADLKDTKVKVTLFKNGEEEVITVDSPFVEGAYDEADFDNPPEEGDDEDENTGDEDQNNGEDENAGDEDQNAGEDENAGDEDQNAGEDENTGDEDQNNGEDENAGDEDQNNGEDENTGDEDQNAGDDQNTEEDDNADEDQNTGDDQEGTDDPESDDESDIIVEVENGDDEVEDGNLSVESDSSDNGENTLPNTATNNFTMLAVGLGLLAVGGVLMVFRRKTV